MLYLPNKKALQSPDIQGIILIQSDPGGIRTHDPQLRRLLLCPAELPDLIYCKNRKF